MRLAMMAATVSEAWATSPKVASMACRAWGRGMSLRMISRDDPQGALGAHQQAGEIVAGDALDGAGAGLDRLPRGREKLRPMM